MRIARRIRTLIGSVAGRRGETLKIVLIVLASLFVLVMLSCLGVGAVGYFWVQKNLSRMSLTNAAEIQQLTAELTDITLPPEFVPKAGSALLGMRTVMYQWCTDGNCPPEPGDLDEIEGWTLGQMNLIGMNNDEAGPPANFNAEQDFTESMSEQNLDEEFASFTKTVHDVTIRGTVCHFYIIRGILQSNAEVVAKDERQPSVGDAPTSTDAQPPAGAVVVDDSAPTIDQLAAAPPAKTGPVMYWIHGVFPGKAGMVTLDAHMSDEQFDETKILGMIRSIR